jgi:predicted  nucleic acid-binding Zn-ribbon protein
MLEQLRTIMTREPVPDPVQQQVALLEQHIADVQETLRQRTQTYEETISTKEREIKDLHTQLEVLRNLTLTVSGTFPMEASAMAPQVHLDTLSPNIESATIAVQQLQNALPGWSEGTSGLHPSVTSVVETIARLQEALHNAKQELQVHLQAERDRLRLAQEAFSRQTQA